MAKTVFHRWIHDPAVFPHLVSLYPPLLGSGIRVPRVSRDWTEGTVTMRVRPWTANAHGAAFGGSLFSATDILYGMMLAAQLGKGFEVWTKTASIDFVNPGRGKLTLRVQVTPEEVASIRERAAREGGRTDAQHVAVIVDESGETVATAHHTMRVRMRR
ncbi:YiiD C-terminal domain-containing protein [Gordonia jinhuaensis]|uniref:Acyl-coenzyme A thioesterase PaaI, contains HGG motif n=1 Tax=Gordonia jinhuaensis TaxID=1517702 RepID=A0A916TDD9_9ACTN|nr:DUF4442 domain-containing protein [Gordonia jinhuaensis]GGB39113.1 hypothetical protein GCM10011489_28510 [Gordonia jinhuaensis]